MGKLVKVKNKKLKVEIAKEQKVLDVAKGLAAVKGDLHQDAVSKEKEKNTEKDRAERKKQHELGAKNAVAKKELAKQKKAFEKLKRRGMKKRGVGSRPKDRSKQSRSKYESKQTSKYRS